MAHLRTIHGLVAQLARTHGINPRNWEGPQLNLRAEVTVVFHPLPKCAALADANLWDTDCQPSTSSHDRRWPRSNRRCATSGRTRAAGRGSGDGPAYPARIPQPTRKRPETTGIPEARNARSEHVSSRPPAGHRRFAVRSDVGGPRSLAPGRREERYARPPRPGDRRPRRWLGRTSDEAASSHGPRETGKLVALNSANQTRRWNGRLPERPRNGSMTWHGMEPEDAAKNRREWGGASE